MARKYLELMSTPSVQREQTRYYGRARPVPSDAENDQLGPDELFFISQRDSFYLATVNEAGWPYVQHRGGRPGFLFPLSPRQLGFLDVQGNRQLLTAGNLVVNNKAALFLMDYPSQTRLKIIGQASLMDARENPALVEKFPAIGGHGKAERIFLMDVVSFDWNCNQYITPRFTEAEVREAIKPLHERIRELEEELAASRASPPPAKQTG